MSAISRAPPTPCDLTPLRLIVDLMGLMSDHANEENQLA